MRKHHIYPSKTELIFEHVPNAVTFSIGLYVKVGSRYETSKERGYSHFIEHLLFKSTRNRTGKDIILEIERVGGSINAYTTQEYTCFYISLHSDYKKVAFDILSDMIFFPRFDEKEIELEKQVVLEEMKQSEDSPDDYIADFFIKNVFSNHPLGYEIIGTKESILNANKDLIKTFYKKFYNLDNFLISIAGNVEFSECKDLVDFYFIDKVSNITQREFQTKPLKKFSTFKENKNLEQTYFVLGAEGFAKDLFTNIQIACLDYIFGSSMSSRLFQRIREDLGFCYFISSSYLSYIDTGIFSIFCSTSTDKFDDCLNEIYKQIKILLQDKISQTEFEDSISHNIGSLSIRGQLVESKMSNNALSQIYYGKTFSLEEKISEFRKVKLNHLNILIDKIFNIPSFHLSAVGKF